MVKGIKVVNGEVPWNAISGGKILATYVIGSTKTSLIPSISIAGSMPIATLFTPALDVEYLVFGKPITLDIIPTTPDGIPTPAIITRVALTLSGIPYLIIDSGSYIEPLTPKVVLPSRSVGGRIDVEPALPLGTSLKLFNEAFHIGSTLGSLTNVLLIGESIPAGTTTAMAILCALGFKCHEMVSSSMKSNPMEIKRYVVNEAIKRLENYPALDVFKVNDLVGDPVHISIAGMALGATTSGSYVVLAGGTQMLAVLAIMKRIKPDFNQKSLTHATTKWVIMDRGKEILNFLHSELPYITLVYSELDFNSSPFKGLKAYEEGYVKEGVGAGGTSFIALARGVHYDELLSSIYSEYSRLVGGKYA